MVMARLVVMVMVMARMVVVVHGDGNNGDGKTGNDGDGKKDDGETGDGGDGGGASETDALTSRTQAVIEIVTSPLKGDYIYACYIYIYTR